MPSITTTDEVKNRLKIKTTEHDVFIGTKLDGIERTVLSYLNNDFLNDKGTAEYPEDLKDVIADLILNDLSNANSKGAESERIGNYTITYKNKDNPRAEILSRVNHYRKLKW